MKKQRHMLQNNQGLIQEADITIVNIHVPNMYFGGKNGNSDRRFSWASKSLCTVSDCTGEYKYTCVELKLYIVIGISPQMIY